MQLNLISCFLFLITISNGARLPLSQSLTANSTGDDEAYLEFVSARIPNRQSCSGLYFGAGLQSASCFQAWQQMPRSNFVQSYGGRPPRGERQLKDVELPLRYLSDDGLCAIDVNQKRHLVGREGDWTTDAVISDNAKLVLDHCVGQGAQGVGGMIKDFSQCSLVPVTALQVLVGLAVAYVVLKAKHHLCGER